MESLVHISSHIGASLFLFILINWIGKHSGFLGYVQLNFAVAEDEAPLFNALFRILSPVVFLFLWAASMYSLGLDTLVDNAWQIVALYFAWRFSFNLIMDRTLLINWRYQFAIAVVSTYTAYFCYQNWLSERQFLFPDLSTFANELWLLIIVYLYTVLNRVQFSNGGRERRKKYVESKLDEYRRLYGGLVSGAADGDLEFEIMAYAVIIFEAFNRPQAARFVERLTFPFFSRTLGVMQVATKRPITDETSVDIGVEKLRESYLFHKAKIQDEPNPYQGYRRTAVFETIADYNRDDGYVYGVLEVYGYLEHIVRPGGRQPDADSSEDSAPQPE